MIPSRQRSCYIKYERNRTAKMKVVVCIGSSCHIKGSRLVVERLQVLVAEHGVGDKVDLSGTFCLGRWGLRSCRRRAFFGLTGYGGRIFYRKCAWKARRVRISRIAAFQLMT